MKNERNSSGKVLAQRSKMRFRTTMLDLIAGLMDRTADEASLLGAVKHIFAISDVRAVRSLAPVRLIMEESVGRRHAGARLRKAKTVWA